jgi:hypothetical protein
LGRGLYYDKSIALGTFFKGQGAKKYEKKIKTKINRTK